MRIEVKVPQLPESVAEATLVNWHKKTGEAVRRDENLIDVETDKVVLELPSPGDGVLVEITRPDGSTVTSNDVIAVIDTDGKADGTATAKSSAAKSTAPAAAAPSSATASAAPAQQVDGVTALPAARKMMADQNVDPTSIEGTGRGGRITKGDVAEAVSARAQP
ncbi:MAG TPA: biotin/lipoyl-containing protein, partial [Casimicrobiaceae bacterium]|nr:biotin/lipoyl-containing protein [Casimicrobiaceae bacterium]